MTANSEPATTESRFVEVSRRAFIRRAATAVGAVAFFPVLTACSEEAPQFEPVSSTAATTAAPTTTTAVAQAPTTTVTEAPTTAAPQPADGALLPVGTEVVIGFSYNADGSGSGRVRNPYVAVWIEDQTGDLVNTVALWFLQTQKGLRWLTDLRRWYSVDGSDLAIDALSSATRPPGDYAVVWDTTDLDGGVVAAGEYFVCIEAAREHGPYSLIREPVSISVADAVVALPDEGELSNGVLTLTLP